MKTDQNAWDAEYQHRGRLWGGSVPSSPPQKQSSRILELGCGDGKTVSSLAQSGRCVTAIDSSPCAASLCRKTCPDPKQVAVLIADCRKIPFRNESFDRVSASHITGHLSHEERCQLAGEVLRLLTPGGTLSFRDFSTEDFRYGRGRKTEMGTFIRKNGIITHYFTDNEVTALFTGFTVESLVHHRWEMRIRERILPRAEIVAEFTKPA
jgi:ubiquinone/menaquinone biosynthesis C-methylase UbiE